MSDVKVGVFVLSALALLVFGALWLAGSTIGAGRRVVYHVLLEDSAGLQAGDRVRVAGVSVGRIQRVTLRPAEEWPVVLDIAIKPDIQPREDGSAGIATSGLMGSAYLQLDVGTSVAASLDPGGHIYGRTAGGIEGALGQVGEVSERVVALLDQTSEVMERVSGDLTPLLQNAEQFLGADNAREFSQLLAGLRRTVDDASPRIDDLLDRLEGVAGQVEHTATDLPELTDGIVALVEDLRTALGPDGQRLTAALDAATVTLGSADEALSVLGDNRSELDATIRDLRETAANLKSFSQQVKERPSSLIRVKPAPDRRPGDGVVGGQR
jgi:phospholipid/cholesterol/gamma-HCH transport system substrate-binding protein